jgi:methylated-DNA-[protein]-cysteine S-methyltransferase
MWTTLETPAGPMRIVAHRDALTAVEFTGPPPVSASSRTSSVVAVQRSEGRPVGDRADEHPLLRDAVAQLGGYFARDLKEFDLPIAAEGTPFQQRVWEQLRLIGYGETTSYGELARRLGMTTAASRAVGLANGRNPVAIMIPCHRVIGAGGKLIGYAGGLDRKQLLLSLEQEALF